MIRSVTVTNPALDRLVIELQAPVKTGLVIRDIEGLGPVKASINNTKLANSDGSKYNSSKLEERDIKFTFRIQNDFTPWTIEEIKRKLYKFFTPKSQIELDFETDTRVVSIFGRVEENEPDFFSKNTECSILVNCPNPYFFKTDEEQIHTFYGIEPTFEFPFCNDSLTEPLLQFGNIVNNSEKQFLYEGDADVGFQVHIHAVGPVGDLTIFNILTRKSVTLSSEKLSAITGSGIIAGDDIVIDSYNKRKIYLIRNGVPYNIINALGKQTNWFNLTPGVNIFAFVVTEGDNNLQFRIVNKIIFIGV